MTEEGSVDLLGALFSSVTEHWVDADLQGMTYRLKYRPLSLKEKLSIQNKYANEDKDKQTRAIVKEQCLRMLEKAGNDVTELTSILPEIALVTLYHVILGDISNKKKEVESFYQEKKTRPLKDESKPPHPLDPIVHIGLICKETNMGLQEVSELDELSFYSLLIYINEMAVRESNNYEERMEKK